MRTAPIAIALALMLAPRAGAAQDSLPLAFEVTRKVAPDLSRDPRVPWLRRHAAAVRTVDPTDTDFRDLETLRRSIGDVQVVVLGEGSHGDGATFLAKTRLIKFLHERMGFDLLVFESGIYDVSKAWQQIRRGEDARTAMAGAIGVLPHVAQGQELVRYIAARARTDRPLEVAGMDPQLTGTASFEFLAADLSIYLRTRGLRSTALDSGGIVYAGIRAMGRMGGYKAPDAAFLDSLMAVTRQIQETPTAAVAASAAEEQAFWLRVLDGLAQQAYDKRHLQAGDARTGAARGYAAGRDFLGRDAQMGQNTVWHALGRRPGGKPRKVIVWTHIAHAEYRDPTPTLQAWDRYWRSMGTVTRELLGAERMYVLGFTAFEGISHNPVMGGNGWPVRVPVKHTPDAVEFEDLIRATGWPNAFVDLRRPAAGGTWLHDTLWARPANVPTRTTWAEAVDGLFYLSAMTPLTRVPLTRSPP